MALPLKYNVRNVFVRWRSTLATILGIALVVAVYMLVQALAVGLEKSSRHTGDPRNIMIVRKGSTAESSSQVTREQFRLLPYLPQVRAQSILFARDLAARFGGRSFAHDHDVPRIARVPARFLQPNRERLHQHIDSDYK